MREDAVLTAELFYPAGESRREKIGSILIRSESDLTRVRDRVRLVARELGFDNVTQIKLTTAASELTRNIYEYARTGSISISVVARDGQKGMEIVYEDNGPGIPELDRILAGDFQSRTGLGKGIAGSRRLMDIFNVETAPGQGTRIVTVK